MPLNETPQGEHVHIALFGRRNVGKSSLINTLTGQEVSIISDVKGTTTDPVYKAMELLPLRPARPRGAAVGEGVTGYWNGGILE